MTRSAAIIDQPRREAPRHPEWADEAETVMVLAPKRLTLDEFLQLPEEEPPLEYSDGKAERKVSPKGKHSWLQMTLMQLINAAAQPQRIGVALAEGRVTFAGKSRVPDIIVYRWDRIPRDASGEVANDFTTPPDVAIEIVSPGQSVNALVRRCRWYVANGVHLVLLIDPDDRSVLAFRPGGVIHELHGAHRIDLAPVLPDFELTVDALFGALTLRSRADD